MELIEAFIKGKVSQELCEDSLYISKDFVAVIDGVSSKSSFRYQGKTTGKLASEIIHTAFDGIRREAKLGEVLHALNCQLRRFYDEVDFTDDRKLKGLQAACVIYSDFHREIWMIGDCQAWVDGERYENPKRSDEVLSAMRSLVIHTLLMENHDMAEAQRVARKVIEPWIVRSNIFANRETRDYGYAVLSGEEVPESLVRKIKLDDKPHKLILTSDGYPEIKENLEQTEACLKTVLHQDSACCELYLSTKGLIEGQNSFDDRTYVAFYV